MLEVFDELGIKPKVIAGCSIGALMGAGYAGGMSAAEIRARAEMLLANRIGAMRYAFGEKRVSPFDLLAMKGLASLHIQGETLAGLALPETLPQLIEELPIPFKVIATDFDLMEERVIEAGPLVKAVAASIAIPGVILGPEYDGHSYVDGGVTNPVPFDHVRDGVDIVVAVDVTGRPRAANGASRSNMELAVGSLLILFNQVASLRRSLSPPDIYIRPATHDFAGGDFFRIREVLEQSATAKDQLKRELEKRITALA
jgi:NTE family protein